MNESSLLKRPNGSVGLLGIIGGLEESGVVRVQQSRCAGECARFPELRALLAPSRHCEPLAGDLVGSPAASPDHRKAVVAAVSARTSLGIIVPPVQVDGR